MLQIIANKTAGNGRGTKIMKEVKTLLKKKGIPHQLHITTRPGHARILADEVIKNRDREIICIGGDGTISEIVDGLAGRYATIYFVPCGTGNDFIRNLNLPKDPIEALEAQLTGIPRPVDVGRVNDWYFLNISGMGFDVEVLRQAERFKKLGKGLVPYLLGIFAALYHFKAWPMEIAINNRTVKKEVSLISVGNGKYYGGGMKVLPHASIDDGLFDVIIAEKVNRLTVIRLLSTFISGKHTDLPIVHEIRCRELTIRCPGMTVNIDGELHEMDEARYQLLPAALEIKMPR